MLIDVVNIHVRGAVAMAKNLIIVESPAKSKTIKKFLGKNYEVVASNGHVRDMPKSQMGIDFDNDFEPHYITIRGKGELLAGLRKEVKRLTGSILRQTRTGRGRRYPGICARL